MGRDASFETATEEKVRSLPGASQMSAHAAAVWSWLGAHPDLR
jgi:hypothetical protein